MGGLTPVYASPEVVRRPAQPAQRPVQPGDRVSGDAHRRTCRFPGRTPAQLASQHLHARPRLALAVGRRPAGDRPARLSKDPRQRFPSCRANDRLPVGRRNGEDIAPSASRSAPAAKSASDTTSVRSREAKTDIESSRRARSGLRLVAARRTAKRWSWASRRSSQSRNSKATRALPCRSRRTCPS